MKWLLGALAALLVACTVLGVWVKVEVDHNTALTAQVLDLQDKAAIAADNLKKTQDSCSVTDKAVASYTAQVEGLDATAVVINNKLDSNLAKVVQTTQVKTNETSKASVGVDARTDAILSDSMWDTYCSVQPNDTDCTARQSTH